jgi:NAD(P)-dependent dehydrogenase (short-subunit alcohol dehydrogenase family)
MTVTMVTGGTRGIGAAISRRVATEGGHVAAVYRADEAAAEQFAADAKADGLSISVHQAELADVAACTNVAAEIAEAFGPVRHLVNNAGLLLEAKVADTTVELWDTVLDVNCRAAFFLAQDHVVVG